MGWLDEYTAKFIRDSHFDMVCRYNFLFTYYNRYLQLRKTLCGGRMCANTSCSKEHISKTGQGDYGYIK